jgi:bifunctional ADP-heptose synthase (sugar kinase/adenylyltransferase)
MLVFERGAGPTEIPIVGGDDIVDVTGAGDTVCAALALSLASGAGFVEGAWVANCAASVVVMKEGTAVCATEELLSAIDRAARQRDEAPR